MLTVPPAAHAQVTWPVVADSTGSSTTGAQPAPGQVIVRLNGRFRAFAGWLDDGAARETGSGVPILLPGPGGGLLPAPAAARQTRSDYAITQSIRLYPGLDGVTAGGWRYGASIEIRQDGATGLDRGVAAARAGTDAPRGTLYVRRQWGYVGAPGLGTLRFGATDGASALFLTGVLENFNEGGWNGDVRYALAPAAQLRWPFADDTNVIATNRIVYLSPSIGGVDLGLSFEPDGATGSIAGACAATGILPPGDTPGTYGGCDRLASTSVALESGRRRDTVEVVLRYRHAFDNGVGLAATLGYTGGGHAGYAGPGAVESGTGMVRAVTYEGLSVGEAGLALTYAGVQLGAHYQWGRYNTALANGLSQSLVPAPAGAKGANAWTVGASYTFGPAVVGAAWVDSTSQGAFAYGAGPTVAASRVASGLGERREQGLNAGGTLKVAPGLGVFLSYMYDERRQAGYDFANGAITAGTAAPTQGNRIQGQALTLGTSVNW